MTCSQFSFSRRSFARQRQGGFTLIEIMVVLGILVLLAGLGGHGFSMYNDNKKLQNCFDDVAFWAKKAWKRSVGEQQKMSIYFKDSTMHLEVLGAKREEDKQFQKDTDKALERKPAHESKTFDPDIRFFIKHFGQEKWEIATPANSQWIFQSNGLCEPIQLRIERIRDGHIQAVEMSFAPLTASVRRADFVD